jgi:phosphate transport system substrate-binding protein
MKQFAIIGRYGSAALGMLVVLLAPTLFASIPDRGDQLSDYQPTQKISGVIRSSGSAQMAALMKAWQQGFTRFHPEVRFVDVLKGTASGMYGLEMRTADLAAMGRPMNPFERYGTYERSWVYPVEIEVASGSVATPHRSPAYAILVHRDNPVAKLSLKQLDGIFGAERSGGWTALSWNEQAARTRAQNIRTWGQLGVSGPLADKPIHVYGPPLLGSGVITFFQTRVLQGGAMWNEDLREYADRDAMMRDLSNDPLGIAYTALSYATRDVKPVALAEADAGPYVELTAATVADRSYPLSRPIYLVYTIDNEKAEFSDPRGDPRVREFLRYVLSKQGQEAVAGEGVYLPLPPSVVREQLKKLDATGTPPERELLKL